MIKCQKDTIKHISGNSLEDIKKETIVKMLKKDIIKHFEYREEKHEVFPGTKLIVKYKNKQLEYTLLYNNHAEELKAHIESKLFDAIAEYIMEDLKV